MSQFSFSHQRYKYKTNALSPIATTVLLLSKHGIHFLKTDTKFE